MQVFNRLYNITIDNQLSFNEKMLALLAVGIEVFDLQLGIVSEIINDQYIVRYAISPDNSLEAGTVFLLKNTYCVHTLNANKSTSFHHAGESHINQHPCYQGFGLESYIGAPLLVDGQRYGTLNFSAEAPRAKRFTKEDHDLIELLALWIGNEIARNQKILLLEAQQAELERQQRVLQDMGQLAGVGAWEVDLNKNTVYWSAVTKKIHDVDQSYIPDLESGINFYKEGESRDRIRACVEKAIAEGGRFGGEFEIVSYTGKTKWIATEGRAEFENGQCTRLVGAFQDITKQVFYREQLEKRHKELSLAMDARSLFLANMSHELRTPINGVLGILQVIRSDNFDAEQARFLGIARDSASTLLALVNDLLDFSKIDTGQVDFELLPMNVNKYLTDFIKVFDLSASKKSLRFDVDFSATEGVFVKADPMRIHQIVANLLSNAIKFTHQGFIKITSSIQQRDQQRVELVISVEDSGIGIMPEKIPELFLPFRQADISTTRQYGGTGLGLSISQQLAKLMNGKISVQSLVGKGSTFTVNLDLLVDSTKSIATEEQIDSLNTDLSQLRVLVVEDNEINLVVVCEMLRQRGVNFDTAKDGIECLAKLGDTATPPFSLVLMDCQMPNMDGYEATVAIRSKASHYQSIPIVALTANAMLEDRQKCLALGMNHYLSKPLDKKNLYNVLKSYVK